MTAPTLHRTERCTEFPPEQYIAPETLEKFFRTFYAFKDAKQRAVNLFQRWLTLSCTGGTGDMLVVWCVRCCRHHECCMCGTSKTDLSQWRISKENFYKLRGRLEGGRIELGGYLNIYTLEYMEYTKR